jgi:imidazolonepropionase-like amidohydrolase
MNYMLLKNCIITDTDSGSEYKKDILIEDKKIKQIRDNIDFEAENLRVIDAQENRVLPGLIDCHTHMGIIEEGTGKLGLDNNETSGPVTPHIRALDAVNPLDMAFPDAVRSGVTCVMCTPGSNNPVGGQNLTMKTYGNIIDKMVIQNPLGIKIAFGEDPMGTYGTKDKCPVTRMGVAALIRETFMRAQDYMINKEQGKIVERDIKLEAIIPALKGEIYVRAHAHRADDIVTAIRIAEEFNIQKLVIEHGTEANKIKEYLVEKKVPVAFGPMLTPRIKMELISRDYSAALHLVESGVKLALMTDHPYNSIDQLRAIAILAISEGLKSTDGIKAITSWPSEILGLQERMGKIQEGFDADIVIYSGNPMDIMSRVVLTIIDGNLVYVNDRHRDKVKINDKK